MKSYSEILTEVLVSQSSSELFYTGNTDEGAKSITREVVDSINADRASIWLFNKDRDSIILQQLYVKAEKNFYQDTTLNKKDFFDYFSALEENPIIIANDAEKHPATECFLENYLKPLGVKSMLDVPVWYKGLLIGVICIESLTPRSWKDEEIHFSQILSSLYSFAYSVKESNNLSLVIERKEKEISNRMNAINQSNAVIEFDLDGKIRFANNLFLKTLGYESNEEIVGKHHSIFVEDEFKESEEYKKFWEILRSGQFFSGEITRKKKNGELVYLQATYNPIIGTDGKTYQVMKIATDITQNFIQQIEIEKKNTYLEHAAKILRHDMHSGINTYMPRGLSSLERRLTEEQIKELKIDAPLKMIKEGLRHTQKVYKGVYEFTNLVKKDVVLNRVNCNLNLILEDYLSATAYRPQVILEDLGELEVNEALFCTSIDNLIRNGLKYNDSNTKFVKIYRVEDTLFIEDNGRGLSQADFDYLSKPYVRKEGQAESGTGLGLNICIAILSEHGFTIKCSKLPEIGTQMKIKLK
jgi:PAS domain S-box-containing protein